MPGSSKIGYRTRNSVSKKRKFMRVKIVKDKAQFSSPAVSSVPINLIIHISFPRAGRLSFPLLEFCLTKEVKIMGH